MVYYLTNGIVSGMTLTALRDVLIVVNYAAWRVHPKCVYHLANLRLPSIQLILINIKRTYICIWRPESVMRK